MLQNQQDGSQPIAIFNPLDKSVEFFGDLDITNFYNKTEISSMSAGGSTDLSNYYNKTEVDATVANINFSNNRYDKTEVNDIDNELPALKLNTYIKTEIDTSLSDYSTITYLQDNYMTSLLIAQALMNNYASVTFIIDNFYSKTEIDSSLSDSYCTKSKIDTTLNLYPPTAQILNNFYSKLYIDNTFSLSAQTGTLYFNATETDNLFLSYSTGSYVGYTFYNKTETGTLLADKLTNIGDISLPGWLDIGTSGYTNSRIRCNAAVGGHTGYAELKANGNWDMFLNLQTTCPNGGWMDFKINNDDNMQLSGSGHKVNIYKDTVIKRRLDVGKNQDYSTSTLVIQMVMGFQVLCHLQHGVVKTAHGTYHQILQMSKWKLNYLGIYL